MIWGILFSTLAFAINFNFDPNALVDEATVTAALACDAEGNSNTASESLCSGSYESLCGPKLTPSLINAEQLRKRIWDQSGKLMNNVADALGHSRSEAQFKKTANEYVKIVLKAQQAVDEEAAKHGVPKNGIRTQLELVKKALVSQLANYPQFAGREQAMRKVQGIQLLDAAALKRTDPEQIEMYFMSCGADGLVPQAAYDPERNQIVVCPGYLLDNLKAEGLDAMNMLLGHEIGHAVDPLVEEIKTGPKFPFRKNYDEYLSCVRKNYAKEFLTRGQALHTKSEKQKLALAACEKNMRARHSTKSEISMARTLLPEPEKVGHGPADEDAVQAHAGELAADLIGTEISGSMLAGTPVWDRPALVRAQLSFFCSADSQGNTLHEICGLPFSPAGDRGEDGEHPRFRFRVETALQNPKIREAMGCAARPSSAKPWCSLAGKSR